MAIHKWDEGQNIVDMDENPIVGEQARYDFFEMMRQEHLEIIRQQRNFLISETDWTQLGDIPEDMKIKWQNYRQELRDITEKYDFIGDVIWPVKPE